MTTTISLSRRSGIFVITIDNPPVNALGHDVRLALASALEEAEGDATCDAVIIHGAGKLFSAGADIREFGAPPQTSFLPDVIRRIERCRKPVAAAIHGAAMGGGLEVALACHLRVAADDALLSLPEVTLGLLPGAGGTQRLPRLVGMAAALEMLTSGKAVTARKALDLGLVDAIAPEGAFIDCAIAKLRTLSGTVGAAPRRTLDLAPPAPTDVDRACDAFLAKAKFKGAIAPAAIVETVRNGLKGSADAGLAIERTAFAALRDGPQSKALRYSFFSERQAAKAPAFAQGTPRPVAHVGIIGAGTMGTGIALALLAADIPVILFEQSVEALERGQATIAKTLARNVEGGRISAQAADAALERCRTTTDMAALAHVDLVIEAAYETMEVKTAIFSVLSKIAKPGAILASNTSYLDIDRIAASTDRPQDVVGLHFFSPANIMKLLEIVKGRHTAPDILATALNLAKRIGKTPVIAGNGHGFIGNRMLAVRKAQAEAMIFAGASPYDVDRVLETFGLPMGPFRISDLAGLDLGWVKEESRGETIRDQLCELGRRGQKTGAGYYDYDEQRRAIPSSEVETLIAHFAADHGYERRVLNDKEILDRLLLPLVNEGVRILAEGKALRGSDIDVVWRGGYGWPAWRGGPMHWAQSEGLPDIVLRLQAIDIAPEPLLVDMASNGGDLTEYTNPVLID